MAQRRKGEITPVDEEFRGTAVQDHPERGRIEALFDQNLFRLQLRRERSAAFWMAATIWGTGGLIIGALIGGYMMYSAYVGLSDPVRRNIMDGMVVRTATSQANDHELSLGDPQNPQQQPQQQH
ncbi:MAG: hypothetical protein ABUS48_04220 [Pseudomonadota bacterium]